LPLHDRRHDCGRKEILLTRPDRSKLIGRGDLTPPLLRSRHQHW